MKHVRAVLFCVAAMTFMTTSAGCRQQQIFPKKLSNETFLAAAELAYEKFQPDEIDKPIIDHQLITQPLATKVHKNLSGYRLLSVKMINGNHGAIALKNVKTNSIIFSFSGLRSINLQAIYSKLAEFQPPTNQTSPVVVDDQATVAYDWVRSILKQQKNANSSIYLTGHSFGGYLAQYVGLRLNEGNKNKYPIIQGVTFNALGILLDNQDKKLHNKTVALQKEYKPIFTNYIIMGDPLDYANGTFFKEITGYTLQHLGNTNYLTVDDKYKTALKALNQSTDMWTRASKLRPLYPYHSLTEFEKVFWK